MRSHIGSVRTSSGLTLDFHLLPEWRIDEVIEEMDEGRRQRFVNELKRRISSSETMFYAEVPAEGAPGETMGVASWRVRSWPRLEGPRERGGLVEISFIHVKPTAREMGVGTALMKEAIRQAGEHFDRKGSSLRKVYGLVPSNEEYMIDVYRHWGFSEEARFRKHFSEEYDIVMMSRFI